MTFYLATKNMKKLAELQRILAPCGFSVICEKDLAEPLEEVEETGTTFEENALLKAQAACDALNMPAIADDSGLAVDALGGRPGIYSARFAGEDCNDDNNIDLLLSLMKDVPENERTARFVSAVACVFPNGRRFTVRGTVEGTIGFEREGEGGFGYDPVFISELGSFGAISSEMKDSISHRGKALNLLKNRLTEPKILVFGGTFDPPHKAHVQMVAAAAQLINPEKVLIIPTATPPHKEREGISDAAHRMEMCRLAFEGIPNAEISDLEIARGGKSYTVDTLTALTEEYPDRELVMLCGGDMFATLDKWVRWQDIIKLATVAGVYRPDYISEYDAAMKRLCDKGARIEMIPFELTEISSTEIRQSIAKGAEIGGKVSEEVEEYIKENRLYGEN